MPLLFSYGTLQDRRVQLAVFGRELAGRSDGLPGYTRGRVPITDPEVLASGNETHYSNAVPSPHSEDVVTGTAFEVSEEDLTAADDYEEDAEYRRVLVTLSSGDEAWVYLAPVITKG